LRRFIFFAASSCGERPPADPYNYCGSSNQSLAKHPFRVEREEEKEEEEGSRLDLLQCHRSQSDYSDDTSVFLEGG
jgi:hypothetical protein